MSAGAKIALVLSLFAGTLVAVLLGSGAGDALAYSKLVDEVARDPQSFAGRQLRMEGELTQGSIQFRESPCEWRFTLEKNGRSMPVRFPECTVPDTFRDGFGISVTVQGHVVPDGHFLANEVIPRCPSKYEMEQRAARGEAMPHAEVPVGASPGESAAAFDGAVPTAAPAPAAPPAAATAPAEPANPANAPASP